VDSLTILGPLKGPQSDNILSNPRTDDALPTKPATLDGVK